MAHQQLTDITAERTMLDRNVRVVRVVAIIAVAIGLALIGVNMLTDNTPGATDNPDAEQSSPIGRSSSTDEDHSAGGEHPAGHAAAAAEGHGGGHHFKGYVEQEHPWLHSYLLNFCFFVSLSLGALFFVVLHHLTRAGWSTVVRRIAEAVAMNIALLALLAIPILTSSGVHSLFAWANEGQAAADPLIVAKAAYLNYADGLFPPAFLPRSILFFALWVAFAYFLRSQSIAQDHTGDERHTHLCQRFAPLMMIAVGLSMTYFAFDYLMSLDAHFFSTIFGVYYFGGSFMAAMAFLAIICGLLQQGGYLTKAITKEHYQDIGKLTFAFLVFWTYAAFSQYMLIWYGNMPEETEWYLLRQSTASWTAFSFLLLGGHFALPFFFLLSKHIKRNRTTLAIGAGWVLFMHWFDMYYIVMPHVRSHAALPKPIDFGLFLAMGGVYALGLLYWLKSAALVPLKDPRLTESLAFENV